MEKGKGKGKEKEKARHSHQKWKKRNTDKNCQRIKRSYFQNIVTPRYHCKRKCKPQLKVRRKPHCTWMSTSHQHFSELIFEIVPQPFFMLAHLKINSNMCLFDGYLLMSYQRNMMFKFRHFRQFKGCLYHIMWSTYGSVYAGREKWPFNVISFLKVEPPCDQTWWGNPVFQLPVVNHMFLVPKTLWLDLWGHFNVP